MIATYLAYSSPAAAKAPKTLKMSLFSKYLSFSKRQKIIKPESALSLETVSESLRNMLWNVILETFPIDHTDSPFHFMCLHFIKYYEKARLDTVSRNFRDLHSRLAKQFFQGAWFQVYDITEFLLNNYQEIMNQYRRKTYASGYGDSPYRFQRDLNEVLENEKAGYRFIEFLLVPISNHLELESVSTSVTQLREPQYQNAHQHLINAIDLLSDRTNPDYAGSAREAITAVEALAVKIANCDKNILSAALNKLKYDSRIHPNLINSVQNLYTYTNDAGIRHAKKDANTEIDFAEAKYVLLSCSAFCNYLLAKVAKEPTNDEPYFWW